MELKNAHEYAGRSVYSLDGFTHGTVKSVAMSGGHVAWVNIELDVPNDKGETLVKWKWESCKFA